MNPPPVVVVLAAGLGTRFQDAGHKLLQPLATTSVLGATLSQVAGSGLPMVVVTIEALAAEAGQWVAARDLVVLAESEVRRGGMSQSIVAGVSARSNAGGWLIHPADMPLVLPDTFRAVAAALPGHACVVPHFEGRRGHPVGFASELYSELLQLTGDEGARRLLLRYPSHTIDVADPGVLIDIDTLSDLQSARAQVLAQRAVS